MDMQGLGDLGTAVKMRSPCPRQHIAVAVAINTGHTAVGRSDHYLHVPIVGIRLNESEAIVNARLRPGPVPPRVEFV